MGVFRTSEGREKVRAYYNQILAAFPVKQSYVETKHGRTFIVEAGREENETLLLLHGSCGNSAFWLGDIFPLAERYHVISADIVGEAGNSDENRFNLESGAYAEWIKELLDALNIKEAIIAGNSLGAWMALNFAVRYPERVKKLALLAGAGIAPIKPEFIDKSIKMTENHETGDAGEVFKGEGVPQAVLDFMNLIFENFIPITGELPLYTDEELKRLNMPLIYAVGENDTIIDAEASADRLSKLLPSANIHILKNCGHAIMNAAGILMPFLD